MSKGASLRPSYATHRLPYFHFCAVITTIYEKLGNPSADDPFEPHIAAVSRIYLLYLQLSPSNSLTHEPLLAGFNVQQELKNNNAKFLANAKDWTKK
jgi:hypothetical protein